MREWPRPSKYGKQPPTHKQRPQMSPCISVKSNFTPTDKRSISCVTTVNLTKLMKVAFKRSLLTPAVTMHGSDVTRLATIVQPPLTITMAHESQQFRAKYIAGAVPSVVPLSFEDSAAGVRAPKFLQDHFCQSITSFEVVNEGLTVKPCQPHHPYHHSIPHGVQTSNVIRQHRPSFTSPKQNGHSRTIEKL